MVSEKYSVRDEPAHYSGLILVSFGTSILFINHLIAVPVTPHNEDMGLLKIADQDVMEGIRNGVRLASAFGKHMVYKRFGDDLVQLIRFFFF